MESKLKKPAIDLTDLAIGIIVLGIVVSIGATVLVAQRDARLTELDTITTHNESIIANPNATGTDLANTWFKSIVRLENYTDGTLVPTTNYSTTTSDGGVGNVVFTSSSPFANGTVNATYGWYNTSRSDYALANDAAVGIGEYGNWFKIIVIVGVAALVLSIIFMSFGRRGSAGSVSY